MASARIRLGGGRKPRDQDRAPGGIRRALSLFRSETLARVEEETTNPDRNPIYFLDFAQFQSDEFTIFGKILLRQEITMFPGAGPFSITGRWERIDTEDNRSDLRRLDTLTERFVLRARNRLTARWTLESQGALQKDARSDRGIDEFDVRLGEVQGQLVFQPSPATRINGGAGYTVERDEASTARIRGISATFGGSTTIFLQGRLLADVTWTTPTRVEGEDVSGRFRTEDENELEWRSSAEFRLSEWLNASITYSGRSLEGLRTTHLARAEARALF